MEIAIVIPAKGHSTRVKNKNMFEIKGISLVKRACSKVLECETVTRKYLDTEDEGIIKECQDLVSKGLNIIKRPPELASNYIGANELIAFALHSMPYCDLILQTFATTPLITSKTIDFCVEKFLSDSSGHDSFFTVVKKQEYFWQNNAPLNFDAESLPNSFELDPIYMETHGLYGIYTKDFLRKKTRVGYNPMLIEIPFIESFDIDTYEELKIVDKLLED